jgi:mono/diheme cytochrome c family protein
MKSKSLVSAFVFGVLSMAGLWGCGVPPGGGGGNQNANDNEGGTTAAWIPSKTIGLGLISVHDSESDLYDGNCVGCHGERTNEVALDGVTPAAHATMLGLFGEENDRCLRCHGAGPDFLTASAGGLREPVDMEGVGCVACHGAQPTPGATALYAD